jgi:ATP-binding cassette subfamily B protein
MGSYTYYEMGKEVEWFNKIGSFEFSKSDYECFINKFKELIELDEFKQPIKDSINSWLNNITKSTKLTEEIDSFNFKNVSYGYTSREELAVKDITLSIAKGKKVAFVGPSGSGKSTLVKLLTGLYIPKQGTISLNNTPYANLDRDYFRQKIGLVLQETQLFAGTIRENLLFVNPEATDEKCLDVLKRSASDSILVRAKQGLDTTIGEGGVKISGGEKQRLSIARALLRDPNILIFDEATSALDSLTEEEITKTVKDITSKKDMITILIAHRLSTVMHSDKIFVLEKGVVVEVGDHESLLKEKGLYYAMWREQIGERFNVL